MWRIAARMRRFEVAGCAGRISGDSIRAVGFPPQMSRGPVIGRVVVCLVSWIATILACCVTSAVSGLPVLVAISRIRTRSVRPSIGNATESGRMSRCLCRPCRGAADAANLIPVAGAVSS